MSARQSPMRSLFRFELRSSTTNLLRGLGLLFACQVTVSIALALLYLYNTSPLLEPFLVTAIVAALGLSGGFASRRSFKQQTGLLRLTSAIAMFIASLFYLHFLTAGALGINLTDPSNPNLVWLRLGQIALGSVTTVLALRAWRQPLWHFEGLRLPRRRRRTAQSDPGVRAQIARSESPVRTNPEHVAPHRLPHWDLSLISNFQIPNWLRRSRTQVRLGENQEHRCPYCLDPVQRNDPRGIKVCKVCHTWHHGDCWSITGMCQVPHHN